MENLLDDLNLIEDERRVGFTSPIFVIGIISTYLLFVFKIGPRLMQNREAYKLKEFILSYNIIQVASCLYIIRQIWRLTSWSIFDFSVCIDYLPNTDERQLFDNLTYFTFWLKVFELVDTVVFVLRKKQNQITYLHVFHHASTITLVYFIVMYYRGNGALYPIYLNSWVHVIMYTYYSFANVCSAEVMQKFILIKKSITIIQMVQFCMILYQASAMWSNCSVPFILRCYYFVVVCVIFYGFYDFYKKAYSNSQVNKTNEKSK